MLAIIALLIALVIPSHAFAQDTGGTKFRGISVNMTADDFKAAWPGWREACPPLYAQAPALVTATQTVAQIIKKELDAVRDKIKGLQEKARIQELKNLEASLEEILEEQRYVFFELNGPCVLCARPQAGPGPLSSAPRG
jgi:hypothetical protein